jgi:hypothetical protein
LIFRKRDIIKGFEELELYDFLGFNAEGIEDEEDRTRTRA